jgi:hypothetical protein
MVDAGVALGALIINVDGRDGQNYAAAMHKGAPRVVWTYDMRTLLYACLRAEFGPHYMWKGSRYPRDRRAEFNNLLDRLSLVFSTLTGREITKEAVEAQVDWAITVQRELKGAGHVRNFILNKAAALDAGFITRADLPQTMSVNRLVK